MSRARWGIWCEPKSNRVTGTSVAIGVRVGAGAWLANRKDQTVVTFESAEEAQEFLDRCYQAGEGELPNHYIVRERE